MLLVKVTVGQPVCEAEEEVVMLSEDDVLGTVVTGVDVIWATASSEMLIGVSDEQVCDAFASEVKTYKAESTAS